MRKHKKNPVASYPEDRFFSILTKKDLADLGLVKRLPRGVDTSFLDQSTRKPPKTKKG